MCPSTFALYMVILVLFLNFACGIHLRHKSHETAMAVPDINTLVTSLDLKFNGEKAYILSKPMSKNLMSKRHISPSFVCHNKGREARMELRVESTGSLIITYEHPRYFTATRPSHSLPTAPTLT